MRKRYTPLGVIEHLSTLSYSTLFTLWFLMVIGFGGVFALISWFAPEHGLTNIGREPSMNGLLSAIYFSLITSSTSGFGDIVPIGFSRVLVSVEIMMSVFGVGIFISKISSAQQEISLREVHKVSFDNVTRQIREELFILRRDFDLMLAEAKEDGKLLEKSWQNLLTACHVAEMRIEDIPQLYSAPELYVIDEKRERILIDSVLRTLKQITQVIDAAKKTKGWKSHKEEAHELESLQRCISEFLPKWRIKSPYNRNNKAFDEVKKQLLVIKKHLA